MGCIIRGTPISNEKRIFKIFEFDEVVSEVRLKATPLYYRAYKQQKVLEILISAQNGNIIWKYF